MNRGRASEAWRNRKRRIEPTEEASDSRSRAAALCNDPERLRDEIAQCKAALIQAKAGPASQANAAASVKAGVSTGNAGDVYLPKIAGVKVYRSPAEGVEVFSLGKFDEVIFEGEEQNGFMKVAGSRGSGWVKAIMMRRQ